MPARRRFTDRPAPVPRFAQLCHALDSVPADVLPLAHRCMLLCMSEFANPDGGECYPKIETLAKRCGAGLTRAKQLIRELESGRWIGREPKRFPDGTQTSTRYIVHLNGGRIVPAPRPKRLTVAADGRATVSTTTSDASDAPTKH